MRTPEPRPLRSTQPVRENRGTSVADWTAWPRLATRLRGAEVASAPSALLGGYAGAGVARRLRADVLRAAIVVFGVIVAIVLLVR